jgi:hypothetical protein
MQLGPAAPSSFFQAWMAWAAAGAGASAALVPLIKPIMRVLVAWFDFKGRREAKAMGQTDRCEINHEKVDEEIQHLKDHKVSKGEFKLFETRVLEAMHVNQAETAKLLNSFKEDNDRKLSRISRRVDMLYLIAAGTPAAVVMQENANLGESDF